MKAPIGLILSLILSLFLSEYGTAEIFGKSIDVDLEGGRRKLITKFKDSEKTVEELQGNSRPVKEFLLKDLKRIFDENKDDVEEITSVKPLVRPHVRLAKRTYYSSPGPSRNPGKNSCGPPFKPQYDSGKRYDTGKSYGPGCQSGNQKKYDDDSYDDYKYKKSKSSIDIKKKFKESCSCSDSDDSRCSSKCNKKNHDHNKKINKKTKGCKEHGWDDDSQYC
ncbi:uncharacterized protein LOC142326035 [Lycorma delicatula]|uniref:uncharacterized protein LOC142326035 n=1 Tax=Lycorma delicatula TaxID=130591 RepID=UPI003F519C67